MSSPTEPGSTRSGEGSSPANGAGAAAQGSGDLPPWQRGPAGRARQHAAPEAARPEPARDGGQAGLDDRLNRFMAGGSAPARPTEAEPGPRSEPGPRNEPPRSEPGPRSEPPRSEPGPRSEPPRNERTDVVRADSIRPDAGRRSEQGVAYASEIPDLSGPVPRPPQQQRKPLERPQPDAATKAPAKGTPSAGNRAVHVATRQHKGPVRASMQIRRVDPWSMLKVSLLLSVVLFFVWMIAVAFLYLVLGGMGVWSKLNSNVGDLLTSASGSSGGELVSSGTIFGGAALIGLVNIVLMTAGATLGAFIYNLTTDLVGGVEVTLADRD